MIGHCLRIKATLTEKPIIARVTRICGIVHPLLGEEGFLYVDAEEVNKMQAGRKEAKEIVKEALLYELH